MASSNFAVRDARWWQIRRALRDAANANVRIGIFGDATLASIGKHHEYGAPRAGIPRRSFLRDTLAQQSVKDGVRRIFASSAPRLFSRKMDVRQALGLVGTFCANAVKSRIRSNIPPALKHATIMRKGSSLALVDTGQLINSITFQIVP